MKVVKNYRIVNDTPPPQKKINSIGYSFCLWLENHPTLDLLIGQDYYATVTLLCGAFPPLLETCYDL